ncbi:hypothetical protein MTR67_039625, partial [Solanum verrucosum]
VDPSIRGDVLENLVSSAAADCRNKLLQDKIFKVSTSLSMNLVRYQSVLVSKNEETIRGGQQITRRVFFMCNQCLVSVYILP